LGDFKIWIKLLISKVLEISGEKNIKLEGELEMNLNVVIFTLEAMPLGILTRLQLERGLHLSTTCLFILKRWNSSVLVEA
jgi:hypothetical protein